MKSIKSRIGQLLIISSWLYFFVLMLQITLAYFPIKDDVAFLAIKQEEVHELSPYLTIFYIHVITSIFVLLIGFFQVFPNWKLYPMRWHRVLGYIYVILLLFFAGPSGLYIGYYANGGLLAQIAFLLLGVLWLFYTGRSVRRILNKDIEGHQYDMWRSYALALSALTLRMWKVVIVYLFQPRPLDAYIIVAWLGWVLNLIMVEYLIKRKKENR
ncbi:Predicted membrane protein [Myroides marinus]|uniref:Predicted membrane protein n=2 Tax=Myroides marinus TaxID=703342 RepID=A0A1H6VN97_9FLAO|nr:Predicted membrane protein [Myroides marinus]